MKKEEFTPLWGKNTTLSLGNFPIGTEKMPQSLLDAMVALKRACALSNKGSNRMDAAKADAIIEACDKVLAGGYEHQFPLAVWQTGSGTQTNMNVNEVIATLASEILQAPVHPNDDVNMGQSSNDTFPTAMHLASVKMITDQLLPVFEKTIATLKDLQAKYGHIIKVGRTHLQDATPLTFGQEVSAWTHMFEVSYEQVSDSLKYLRRLSIGATAVGTGINSYVGFDIDVCTALNQAFDETFEPTGNKFHALTSKDAFVFLHGSLASCAANAMKLANDIRHLASGPRAGLGELIIPSNEPGSSIMPGKVNPTQAEALTMCCAQVMGNQTSVTIGASQGNFQLNVYMPLIMYNTWQSIQLLSDALESFRVRCLVGLEPNEAVMHAHLEHSLMTATYLNRKFGYDQVALWVKEAHETDQSIKAVVCGHGAMSALEFDAFFDYASMVKQDER